MNYSLTRDRKEAVREALIITAEKFQKEARALHYARRGADLEERWKGKAALAASLAVAFASASDASLWIAGSEAPL